MKPTIGRIVHYRLSDDDAARIIEMGNRPLPDGRSPLHNASRPGDMYPAIIVRVWDDGSVNARVFLDGELTLWVTSRHEGDEPGTWSWPPRVEG